MNELFQMPEIQPPRLERARIELAKAIEDETKANDAYENADEDEMSPREYRELEEHAVATEQIRHDLEKRAARLEREAIGK